ncbi:amino acid adenylation domain-containing protein [Sorangium sp. So ce124]|uniref:amino acid adenylation domain-containing protein n=1 Tax=Sorangium sp. So ce124 TaxID=3133280 RepID=UPI003F64370E
MDRDRSAIPWPTEPCFHHLFEEQVARTPEAIAARCDGEALSYAQLNAQANRVAHALSALGVGQDARVGLLLDRSLEFLTAMLGAFKAGAAYVPLDPALPLQRLEQMADRSGCAVLVTTPRHEALARRLGHDGRAVRRLEELLAAACSEGDPPRAGAPRSLSYVIFTSGSTGVPKGVMIEHTGMLNHLRAKVHDLRITSRDVVAQTATQTFDVSVWQFLAALLAGAETAIVTDDDAWEPGRLLHRLERDGVTVFETVPSHLRLLLEELEARGDEVDLSALRWLMVTGEALPPDLCARWFRLFPRVPLINAYGPTECSGDVTHYTLQGPPAQAWKAVPISGALPNLRIYILDSHLQPVPAGVVGELCVGGIGVGRGYIGEPDKTARAFVPDPFSATPGARLYRTGDRVRHLPDGTIEFLGRADHQVKIRGVRIEIGEVEAAIASHPDVRACVVVTREDRPGEKRLVAYVVPREPPGPPARALAAYLKERLSEVMVPSAIVSMQELPLLPSGKLDRRALPAPAASDGAPSAAPRHEAPRTPTEAALARIWAELLGVEQVGVHDNFFELGGHSLVAIQTISRARAALGVELSVRALFEHPTVAEVSAHLASRAPAAEGFAAALRRLPPADHYELAPYQLPEWFMHELAPESPFYNVAITNAVLTGNLDVQAFLSAWQALVDRHAVFRTSFGYLEGRPVQRVLPRRELRIQDFYLDFTGVPHDQVDEEMRRVSSHYSGVPLDFEAGPTLIKLAEFPGKRFLLLFCVHHILWDETSTINMALELSELYNATRAGRPPQLPELELDYVDWAQWIHGAVREGLFESQRQHWIRRYATLPPALDLPFDRPRPALQTFSGMTVSRVMSEPVSVRMDRFLQQRGLTLNIFMLAVLSLQIHRLTGQSDFVLGTPIANRNDRRLEKMLGLFATAIPMRCTIAPGASFAELLERTRDEAIAGYDNHNYPIILAIQELNPEFDPSRNRLFSIMFGTQNNKTRLMSEVKFDGLTLEFLPDDTLSKEFESSKFDLTIIIDQLAALKVVRLNYNSDLFDRSTIERMMDQIFSLTEQVLADPSRPLAAYRMLSPAEEARLLVDFNATAEPFDAGATLHERFSAQARLTPEAPALVTEGGVWSYRELDEISNRWARVLRSRGAGREDRVALLLEPSPEMVTAMLAVLKAGAAYVPLHPDSPAGRHAEILRSSGARMLLTSGELSKGVAFDGEIARIDALSAEVRAASGDALDGGAAAGNLAYVIYTSGTTGAPKGIEIEHRGVINLLETTQRRYGLDGGDTALFITPYNFDASILDVFWPLSVGARVVVPRAGDEKDPARIASLIEAHGVTFLQSVPLMLEALVEDRLQGRSPALPSLRRVICGGAAMRRQLRDRALRAFPRCALENHYGPTEVTVDAAQFDCRSDFDGDTVPLGSPIGNARLHVLDAALLPVPIGVTGEIYVASPGLARCYTGDPARTAASFVPDPYSPAPGARLYRTGDLGRYSAGGVVHFLGRVDQQVKVRGNRVELGEVESRLKELPQVARCAVTHLPGSGGEGALAAWVELCDGGDVLRGERGAYRIFTLAQRPELRRQMESLHLGAWPAYFAGDCALRTYWPRLPGEFPRHQYVLLDEEDAVVAAGNAIPIAWDGTVEDLPRGWDHGLEKGFVDAERGVVPNTLFILTGVAAPGAQGQGLATLILQAFKRLGRALGLTRVLVAVRPTGKTAHPELTFSEYCQRRREDGLPCDNWLRSHERVGGRVLKVDLTSQRVRARVSDWACWAGRQFTESGEYQLADTLQPVRINVEEDYGEYYDPSVWMEHPPAEGAWEHVDAHGVREFLKASLPEYMIPAHIRFLSRLPLASSGKVDGAALRALGESLETPRSSAPPRTPIQVQLAEIWKEILEVERVGIGDDFFELGGHSILAVRMLARINEVFSARLGLRDLFLQRTIQGLEPLLRAPDGGEHPGERA